MVDSSLELSGTVGRNETINVWLVDDSENFRVLLAALLEDEGGICCERQFSCAEDAIAALAKDSAPDVMLLDNRMPGMGGLAAVRPITSLAPATHVLMLTTFGDTQLRAQALNDGASDFLLKSFHVAEIANHIREAHIKPRRAAVTTEVLESATRIWPERRAPEETGVGVESAFRKRPEFGRRKAIHEGSQGLLMRGVKYLRGCLGQIAVRAQQTKGMDELVTVETPR